MYLQILITLWAVTGFLSLAQAAQAVFMPQRDLHQSDYSSQIAGSFDGRGRPRSRTSGGTRGDCVDYLIALIPGVEAVEMQVGECMARSESLPTRTLTTTPTFWFYVPAYPESEILSEMLGEFVLLDANGQPIGVKRVDLPQQAGIIRVSSEQPLEIGQQYQWIFSISINPHSPSQNLTVEGLIQVVEPDADLSHQLATALSLTERMDVYKQHEIWQDAITDLADYYCSDSQNTDAQNPQAITRAITSWSELLTSAGLGAIADAPLYCNPSQPVSD